MTFHISPAPLTFASIHHILRDGCKLALSAESKQLIQGCKDYLDRKIASSDRPLYGITTGFGSLCKINISPGDLSRLQANLVMSHACNLGHPVHPEIARLMLLLKAHALSLGKSGVQLATVQRIIDMFNEGVIPVVRELGSLGASGDLAPLANLFLPLIGEGEVLHGGKIQPAAPVCRAFGWEPVALGAKEGLALLNGTQFMSAHAVYALLKSFNLLEHADIIGALSLDAYDGRIEPFLPQIHAARPHPGQVKTARNIRALLEGSQFQQVNKVHVQDPYSFRCIPQVHGASRDAVAYAASVVEREINSVTDNPTIFVDDDLILSGGNFHGQPLALALDFLAIAIAELGSISERRTYRLISGQRKTPEFLIANSGLNSGFMIPQYAAAAIVSQNKQLCTPCSVDSIPSSNEQEDHVSMGGNAATKTVKVVENVERVLAIELMNAAQAIDLQRPLKTS
ncbi:MAG: histidine ammonia-lyase, partial [Odoribacteraceae bacterium]|nr:histidine ammonia-lyase [Odoribacteraceae bacterium]